MSVTARLLALLCLALTQDSTVSKPSSPCPTAFNYFFEKPAGWYGVITILPPAKFSEVKLVLNMTAPFDRPEGGVGRVEVLGGDAEVKAISDRAYRGEQHQIQYKVVFPPHSNDDDVPRVKNLVINGRSFCSNHQEYPDTRSKINLHYTITTGLTLAPASGHQFSVVGSAPLQTATQTPWTQRPIPYQEPITVTQTRRPQSKPKRPRTTTTTPAYEDDEDEDDQDPDEFHVDGLNCGVPTTRGNFLILGGVEAVKGDWPWQAAIYKISGTERRFQCGGTLISNRHVITAAHCVYVKHKKKAVASKTLRIYLGKHSLRRPNEEGQQETNVQRIILHPNYGMNQLDYDVSILILSNTVIFSEYVISVCLWDKNTSLNEVIGKPGTVVGWGRDDEGNVANELKVAKMPVATQEDCLRSDDAFQKLTSNVTFCAGFRNGTSACNGDSGGGMFFRMDNPKQNVKTWYIRGVVSLSILDQEEQRCDVKSYVVFTDLAKILPWLHQQLTPLP